MMRSHLGSNLLAGSIPNLDKLTALHSLYLNRNQLEGSIPNLEKLTALDKLDLANNQLDGSIPSLTSLTALTMLDLDDNQPGVKALPAGLEERRRAGHVGVTGLVD